MDEYRVNERFVCVYCTHSVLCPVLAHMLLAKHDVEVVVLEGLGHSEVCAAVSVGSECTLRTRARGRGDSEIKGTVCSRAHA